jgi:C1A family cysteine protease
MADSAVEYARRMTKKQRATDEERAMYRPLNHGRYEIRFGQRAFRLDRQDEHDLLDVEEKNTARSIAENAAPFWDYDANDAAGAGSRPDIVDHRPNQTDIRDQRNRGTCVCFAALACIEAILKSQQNNVVNLSEQYANWVFMRKTGTYNQCDDGLRTTMSARYLSESGVCEEVDYPYEDLDTVKTHCQSAPPANVKARARYGIGSFTLIDRLGLLGPSIANPDYLETVLLNGYDIVFGTKVAWFRPDANGVFDVKLTKFGNAEPSRGAHSMLIVGYDRTGPEPFFILKNSFGDVVGNDGYFYLSYDYIQTYAKYGYFIGSVRTNMPAPGY